MSGIPKNEQQLIYMWIGSYKNIKILDLISVQILKLIMI